MGVARNPADRGPADVIGVIIADDQALVRGGIRMILEAQDDIEVLGEATDGSQAVALTRDLHPDLVLMDVRMPGLDGIEAARRIVAGPAATRVLMLTTFDRDEYVYEAMKAGASGFLLKSAPPEQLVAAVRITAAGDALLAPAITQRLIEEFVRRPPPGQGVPDQLAGLTERELDVLRLIARGFSNTQIAESLFLGEGTVKTHINRIFRKLAIRDRAQAVVVAYETGLVQPGHGATPPNPNPP
jgi:DNA-binding NarL/FixJ family response regulator